MPEIVRDLLHPLCKHVFRIGRVADVYPYPEQHYLNSLCHRWMRVSVTASLGADQLTQAVGAITNHQQAEWEAAMRTFCSALWGGTARGQRQHGYQWAQTSGAGLLLSFDIKTVLNLDTGKLNGIVAKYTGILDGLTTRMTARKGPLDEAYRRAPQVRGRRRPCARLRHPGPGGVQGLEGLAEGRFERQLRPEPRRQRIHGRRPHFGQARRQDGRAVGAAPA
ncbi:MULTISPECIES: hypothetical protein [unclassified Streptomyces]|uniref:hypothetical protein n=1 Tax=unclassified Streptomyces TaxID=2593676 RepID=UPI00379DC077